MSRSLRMAMILGAAALLAGLGVTGAGTGLGLGQLVSASAPAAAAPPPSSVTTLFAWGDNSSGELGNGSTTDADTPAPVSLPAGVVPDAVAGGGGGGDNLAPEFAAYAIGSDAKLYAWGDNSSGELGDGSTTPASSETPVVVDLPSGVTPVAISAGQGSAYAIGSDGNLYAWGDGGLGKLGDGSTDNTDTPVVVSFPAGVTATAVAAGYESAYAIGSDGNLYAWGDDYYGELGDGTMTNSDTPVVVTLPAGVRPVTIAGGGGVGYAIGSDGNLYSWGLNADGQLGNGSTDNSDTPVLVSMPAGVTATAITGGGAFAHAIGSDGNLYGWGIGTSGQLGVSTISGMATTPVLVTLAPGVTPSAISDNLHTGYAIGSDGNVYSWGYGVAGELGNGTFADGSPPVVVSLPPDSVPLNLGPEPGAAAGYAIVSATPSAPQVTSQPQPQTVLVGGSASFSAAASGYPAPSVQWQVSTDGGATFTPVSGGTSNFLSVPATTLGQNGDEYEAVFSNGTAPDATTDPALLTVDPDVAPTVALQPTDQVSTPGGFVSFTSTAVGDPDPGVVWQDSRDGGKTWANIVGNGTSTSDTLSGPVYGTFENGWEVRAVFTNGGGSATSNSATLTVIAPSAPTVTLEPTNQASHPGDFVSFTATASGDPDPTVVWQVAEDGPTSWKNIQGNRTSTSDELSGPVFGTFENGWEFRAVFTNGAGTATSNPATLSVT
jgi:alpha-tubulin suppressor-like RCC1 family protein